MKNYITFNTKNKYFQVFDENEVIKNFGCDSFYERFELKEEIENYINDVAENEEEKAELEAAIANKEIIENEEEYYTEMIEFSEWCSPKGVISEYKVLSIIDFYPDNIDFNTIKEVIEVYLEEEELEFEIFGKYQEEIKELCNNALAKKKALDEEKRTVEKQIEYLIG